MEVKKHKKHDLERRRPVFFGIGMIVALALAITAFEWKSEVDPIVVWEEDPDDWIDLDVILPIKHKEPEPPKPKKVQRKPILVIEPTQDLKEVVEEQIIKEPIEEPQIEIPSSFFGSDPVDEAPRSYVEKMPTYEGGMERFYAFVASNMKYPRQAQQIGIEGRVYVQFVVEKDGSLSNIKVMKGISRACDQEAIRVMKMVNGFKPGKQGDVRVRVQMVVPINFQLK